MFSKLGTVKTLSERAFEELRTAILEGRIPPGTRLVERILAEDMGISRTPVHDALTNLVKERLVKKLPNNGFAVSRIEKKEIVQLYSLRLHLEVLALQWALPNITAETLRKLKNNVKQMERCASKSDMDCIIKKNVEFHQLILSAADSPILSCFVEQVQANAKLYRIRSVNSPYRVPMVIDEHRKIITAVEKKDEAAAVDSIKEHLGNALDTILSTFSTDELKEVEAL